MNTDILDKASRLSVEEQIELIETLWDNIIDRDAVPGPTVAQKTELDRRLAEHRTQPDDVLPWSDVKTAVMDHLRR